MAPPLPTAAALGIAARPMNDGDLPFVAALYASTREQELTPLGWPPGQLQSFLAQQHQAQHRHYRSQYPGADWLILERGGEPVGRLYLDRHQGGLHLIDLSLLPAVRGQGIGGAILTDLMAASRPHGGKVSLHVAHGNPAARLYERMGFRTVEDSAVYVRMEWDGAALPAQ